MKKNMMMMMMKKKMNNTPEEASEIKFNIPKEGKRIYIII